MLVVGLTGGIATGKSTVSSILAAPPHNIPIIDADLIARQVLDPGTPAYKEVLSHFGPSILLPPSSSSSSASSSSEPLPIDRAALGQRVFNSESDRKVLNSIVHPAVRKEMAWQVLKCYLRGEWVVVVDVPLLIETGLWKWVGRTVVVYVSEQIQLQRLLARPPIPPNPPLTREQALSRINSQIPLPQKLPYADHIIDNSSPLPTVSQSITHLVRSWRRESESFPGWWWCWVCPPLGLFRAAWVLAGRGKRVERRRKNTRGGGASGKRREQEEEVELKVMGGGRRERD
ncbi:dephospho-CoA kinase-domain-containing protein [Mrakia frigida]|uniref:putative dephospho-CoA kinase n=1 Tax=Mrakia frigida TaxID=29902 RepID=UPI003FCC16E8